jgi:transcription elongation factor/antiterminator RfaH
MYNFKAGWYLLYTLPKREKKVAEQLTDSNFNHYLPMLTTARQWADRVKIIREPMFPSYVFIYVEKLSDYFAGLSIEGVLQYVKFGGHAARIRGSVVQNLKLVSEYGKNVVVSSCEFQQGEILTISEGPFAGMNCEMVKYKNEDKLLVRLSLLQRSVLMEVPSNQLIKI